MISIQMAEPLEWPYTCCGYHECCWYGWDFWCICWWFGFDIHDYDDDTGHNTDDVTDDDTDGDTDTDDADDGKYFKPS